MRQSHDYKSPLAAMFWSAVLPGFGQLYNKEYMIGFVLIGLEFLINSQAKLNLAIVYSFHGDFKQAHDIINYQWGMFYPSFYCFSLWQAYNHAKSHQLKLNEIRQTRTYLSGLFLGLAIGMNFGLYWHHLRFLSNHFLDMPVFNGITFGLLGAWFGNFLENRVYRKRKTRINDQKRI
ncbi:DUF5683 domain-containing protein [Neobacillus sp. SM06]|uniref:DUF5683 domain-containing protein n=1 Tax=Neobacillus sp. SM06 TaxID=3422492 RepID=UPI003D2BAEBF